MLFMGGCAMSLYYLVRVLFDSALYRHDHSWWTLGFLGLAAWGLWRSLRRGYRPRFRRPEPRNGSRQGRKRPKKRRIDGEATRSLVERRTPYR